MRSVQYLAVAAALVAPAFAQTFTNCDPTKKTCPADPALGKAVSYDFTAGAPSDFTAAAGKAPTFNSSGAYFTITKDGEAPTLSSNWFIMFGHYKVVMKPAGGQGIVSSLVLQSDDLDEVDWEWVGSQGGKVQTNYYGKGNTTVYDRGLTVTDGTNADGFNTYEVDWTAEHLQWIINGNVVRTLTPATADYNQYPQTPMQLKIGNWAAGDSSSSGTSEWAGGKVDWSKGPFSMVVKKVEVTDYSTGTSYSYGNMSGTWESIKSNGGKIAAINSPPASISTASAVSTKTTLATAATSVAPITGAGVHSSATTTAGVAQQTGAGAGANVSGSGSSGTTPTTSGSASSASPTTGAAAGAAKPMLALAGAGLLAFLAL